MLKLLNINSYHSYPSNTKWLNLGNVNHLSFQLSKSHRVPNVEYVAMCGFKVLPPSHPLASQALHHFRSTKSGISRETQVVQHTDHLIMALLRELRIIDRLSVTWSYLLHLNIYIYIICMFDNFATSSINFSYIILISIWIYVLIIYMYSIYIYI